jgi:hypothetical protein
MFDMLVDLCRADERLGACCHPMVLHSMIDVADQVTTIVVVVVVVVCLFVC